jgi:hypothetical protein
VLPHDLSDEIAGELATARRSLAYDETRVRALEALLELVRRLSGCLRREATLDDVLATAASPAEQAERRRLLAALRGPV